MKKVAARVGGKIQPTPIRSDVDLLEARPRQPQAIQIIGLAASYILDHLLHRVDHQRRLLPVDVVPTACGDDQAAIRAERGLPALRFGPIRGRGHVLLGR
jgi:hypothetical protein